MTTKVLRARTAHKSESCISTTMPIHTSMSGPSSLAGPSKLPHPAPENDQSTCPRFPPGHRLNRHFTSAYQLGQELGIGGYGFVTSARCLRTGEEVAVKFILKSRVPPAAWTQHEQMGMVPIEVMLLCRLDHPNIVKCKDVYEDALYYYLVQELHGLPWQRAVALEQAHNAMPPMDGPIDPNSAARHRRGSYDLFEFIESRQHKHLSESRARDVFAQIVDAVAYLDRRGIAHRDIKDENILIDSAHRVKLVDFGSASVCDPAGPRPFYTDFRGTSTYAAAEVLRGEPYQAAPVEVWALGVLLAFLLTGSSPFATAGDAAQGIVGLVEVPGQHLSDGAMDVLARCLEVNPKTRITIHDLKRHPWVVGRSH
ncbi:kinase-like domain-containing protein [Schizophyllum commune]